MINMQHEKTMFNGFMPLSTMQNCLMIQIKTAVTIHFKI